MKNKIKKLDKEIISEIILNNGCYNYLKEICSFGPRFPGTKGEKLAQDFIIDTMKSFGLETKKEEFEHLGWKELSSSLQIRSPTSEDLLCSSLVGATSTPNQGIEGEILFLGNGTPREFEQLKDQIKGKIVFVTSLTPKDECIPLRQGHRRTKYGRAIEYGARAFIFTNSQPGMLIQTGSTRQNMVGEIPAVTIPFEEGEKLQRYLNLGKVSVKLKVDSQSFKNTSYNLVGELKGEKENEILLVGAHYDSHNNSHGALDNGTGIATLLELARIITQSEVSFRKTIRFVFFGVEEMASVGSSQYIIQHKKELDNIHLFINIDGSGISGGKTFDTHGSKDLSDYIISISQEIEYPMEIKYPDFSGDSASFILGGVPTASLGKGNTPGMFNYTKITNDEDRGWGHTSADTIDKINAYDFYDSAIITGRTIIRAAQHTGKIAQYRTNKEIKDMLDYYGMSEVFYYMKWPTLSVKSMY